MGITKDYNGKWKVQKRMNEKLMYFGHFNTEEDAIEISEKVDELSDLIKMKKASIEEEKFNNKYKIINDMVYIYFKSKGEEYYTVVDLDDFEKIRKAFISVYAKWSGDAVYAYGRIKNGDCSYGYMQIHRFVMDTPRNLVVDHVYSHTLDNRKTRLRNVTQKENSQNINFREVKEPLPQYLIDYHNNTV